MDGGDGLGPTGLMSVEGAAEPFELVGVEEAGDLVPGVFTDAETGIGVWRAPAPLYPASAWIRNSQPAALTISPVASTTPSQYQISSVRRRRQLLVAST